MAHMRRVVDSRAAAVPAHLITVNRREHNLALSQAVVNLQSRFETGLWLNPRFDGLCDEESSR